MKQISLLFILLFATFPGYGDEWDDEYKFYSSLIQLSLNISLEDGYIRATDYAGDCSSYIVGFVHGNVENGNSRELDSKRFTDWHKANGELVDKHTDFVNVSDYGNASYYAKKEFELNCQYMATIKRETLK